MKGLAKSSVTLMAATHADCCTASVRLVCMTI